MSIYIIESNEILANCIKDALPKDTKIFPDIYSAWDAIQDNIPSLIFLDILPTGPDGFTLLNQLVSLKETENIPIILLSAINLKNYNLSDYNIKRILNKETFTPMDIKDCAEKYYAKQ
ncbi:MAG: hypothetical protein Q4E47_03520 [Candidatus Saccharibacteria bacterium]|nr:hypothetical protein [Candidatus Saccharibacteria bacterium]